jgi:hypothetical protein
LAGGLERGVALKALRYGKRWCHPHQETTVASSRAAALHQRLLIAAEKLGVFAREKDMRRAIEQGRFSDAAKLRGENLAVMRGAVARSSV